MPTISLFAPELSGETTLTLELRVATSGVLTNAGGDALTESPASSGRFTASVDEALAVLHQAVVKSGPLTLRDGWLPAGETLVLDAYPSAGGSSDPAAIADAVLDELLAGHGTVGSVGKALTDLLSAGGSLTPEQAAQLAAIVAQTSKLSGAPITINGNVKPGGHIVLHHGDDHTVSVANPALVTVSDLGGTLHALLTGVGVENLEVNAIRGNDSGSRISGTVAAINYAADVLTVTCEFLAAETSKGVVGPAYHYDVSRTGTPTRTYFSGRLTLTRDAR